MRSYFVSLAMAAWFVLSTVHADTPSGILDRVEFGNKASETLHEVQAINGVLDQGGLARTAWRLMPPRDNSTNNWERRYLHALDLPANIFEATELVSHKKLSAGESLKIKPRTTGVACVDEWRRFAVSPSSICSVMASYPTLLATESCACLLRWERCRRFGISAQPKTKPNLL